jgi:hypothetical protein
VYKVPPHGYRALIVAAPSDTILRSPMVLPTEEAMIAAVEMELQRRKLLPTSEGATTTGDKGGTP